MSALAETAAAAGLDLLYEAAVAGAIPLIRPLRESLAGERIRRVMGIVNGTTNYILRPCRRTGSPTPRRWPRPSAWASPSATPAPMSTGTTPPPRRPSSPPLPSAATWWPTTCRARASPTVDPVDIAFADRLGYVVKLLARGASGSTASRRVRRRARDLGAGPSRPCCPAPILWPSVRGAFNAVFVEGDDAGELMLYGQGAGGRPTASAVLGDLIDAAHHLRTGAPARLVPRVRPELRPTDELRCAWYLNIDVADRPGVLAAVAQVFGDNGVSIRSMEQVGLGDEARLIFLTHVAREGDVQRTPGGPARARRRGPRRRRAARHRRRGKDVARRVGRASSRRLPGVPAR